MTELTCRYYATGEQIDALSVAGEPQMQVLAFGITADLFFQPTRVLCPLIDSSAPGSGNLDKFIDMVVVLVGRPLVFVNVINRRLETHLRARGIEILNDDGLEDAKAFF